MTDISSHYRAAEIDFNDYSPKARFALDSNIAVGETVFGYNSEDETGYFLTVAQIIATKDDYILVRLTRIPDSNVRGTWQFDYIDGRLRLRESTNS